MPKTNVKVKLVGKDGNAFAIMGRVRQELRRAGHDDLAKQYTEECMKAQDYSHLLKITDDYVEVR